MKQQDAQQFEKDFRTVSRIVHDIMNNEFSQLDEADRERHTMEILERLAPTVFRQSLEETGATHPGEEYSNI